MIIGVPKEIKTEGYRVGIVPAGVRLLAASGHRVLIEKGAGEGAGISDQEFKAAGAHLASSAAEVYGEAELVMKVQQTMDSKTTFRIVDPTDCSKWREQILVCGVTLKCLPIAIASNMFSRLYSPVN